MYIKNLKIIWIIRQFDSWFFLKVDESWTIYGIRNINIKINMQSALDYSN